MDFNRIKSNFQSGRKIIDGRTFQIEFWDEQLPLIKNRSWCRVCEIKLEECPIIPWYSSKAKMQEVECFIAEFWSECNRLEVAMNYISDYIKKEKDKCEELHQIETFCNDNNNGG